MHGSRHRGTARDADPDRGDVRARQLGMIEQSLEHRRHAGKASGLVLLNDVQHLPSIETRDHGDRGARYHGMIEQRSVGKDVKEGQRAHEDFGRRIAKRVETGYLLCIYRQLRVAQHGAFGPAGRTARILQQGNVALRINIRQLGIGCIAQRVAPAQDRIAIDDAGDLAAAQHSERQTLVPRQHLRQLPDHQRLQPGLF